MVDTGHREPLRGLPKTITTEDKLWVVIGAKKGKRRILEYCHNDIDARAQRLRLSKDMQYSSVFALSYKEALRYVTIDNPVIRKTSNQKAHHR